MPLALSNWDGSARLKSERIASRVDESIVDAYSLYEYSVSIGAF